MTAVILLLVVELISPGTEKEDLGKKPIHATENPPTKWEVGSPKMWVTKQSFSWNATALAVAEFVITTAKAVVFPL